MCYTLRQQTGVRRLSVNAQMLTRQNLEEFPQRVMT